MYFDNVILFGLVVVILTAAVVVYATKYMLQHMKEDAAKHPEELTGHK